MLNIWEYSDNCFCIVVYCFTIIILKKEMLYIVHIIYILKYER